jgi:hypothetical protein
MPIVALLGKLFLLIEAALRPAPARSEQALVPVRVRVRRRR